MKEIFLWYDIPTKEDGSGGAGWAYYPLSRVNEEYKIKLSDFDHNIKHFFEVVPFTLDAENKTEILASLNDNLRFTAIIDEADVLPLDLNKADFIQVYSATHSSAEKRMLLYLDIPKQPIMSGQIWFAGSARSIGAHTIRFIIEDKNTGQVLTWYQYYEVIAG